MSSVEKAKTPSDEVIDQDTGLDRMATVTQDAERVVASAPDVGAMALSGAEAVQSIAHEAEPTGARLLCTTANGKRVWVDLVGSHAATHFADSPGLLEKVTEILSDREVADHQLVFDVDTGEIIGTSDCVEVGPDDKVFWAKRPNRGKAYTKFVDGREPSPTSYVAVVLRKKEDVGDDYDLITAWVGELAPSFPGGPHTTQESLDFWATHALVVGVQEILPDTRRDDDPWQGIIIN